MKMCNWWWKSVGASGQAFLKPSFRNLAFFSVVWHEKMLFGMYVIVWHFLAFLMVLAWKNINWPFLKLLAQLTVGPLSYCCRLRIIKLCQDKGPLFSTTVPFSKMQAALSSKWRHRAKDVIFFGLDFENWGIWHCFVQNRQQCLKQCRHWDTCKYHMMVTKIAKIRLPRQDH